MTTPNASDDAEKWITPILLVGMYNGIATGGKQFSSVLKNNKKTLMCNDHVARNCTPGDLSQRNERLCSYKSLNIYRALFKIAQTGNNLDVFQWMSG